MFSTRKGGVSPGPYESLNLGILTEDDPARVARNRELLAEALGRDPARVAMGWQVHGAEVQVHHEPPAPGRQGFGSPGDDLASVDAQVTDSADVTPLVLVADCVPSRSLRPARWRWSTAGGAVSRPASWSAR